MKDSKYCKYTACCWGLRHEILGLILLVIATLLTIASLNGFGIVAMFLVGGILCCYKHFCCCHSHQEEGHCHSSGEGCDMPADKEKKTSGKPKK